MPEGRGWGKGTREEGRTEAGIDNKRWERESFQKKWAMVSSIQGPEEVGETWKMPSDQEAPAGPGESQISELME